jgi:glycosidase
MKPIIYQLVVRYFGNTNLANQINGSINTNGCGKFNDINANALSALRNLGVTHLWLTGALRQATLTDYSAAGLPADDPDIVKGLAGSFYAVRDYFDVSPDYASTPQNRMQEFESLLQRIHDAGLQALIDLVPNHVSRGYNSTTDPASTLGRSDDPAQFFSSQNNFFYLVDPPNQALQLKKPSAWNPSGVSFDGRYGLEDGSLGRPAKATGNNVTSPSPSENDWYETIKLNYGFNFVTKESTYSPQPRTWRDVDRILAYWQAKGVDGFRCDFAHYIPKEAWTFLISKARQRRPAYFLAEAYPYAGSGDPIQSQEELIEVGFDAVYHYQAYNALKGIYTDGQLDAFDRELVSQTARMRGHFVSYIENHDERRVASPIVRNQGPGASGFGSADAGYDLAPVQFLYGSGPALLFNGQEVGEPGAGYAGFSGEDGRTTIYDYWAMPEFAKWVNGLRYDGAGLNSWQVALRTFYSGLNQVCQNPAVAGDGFWGLRYFNNPERFGDCPGSLYSYARFQSESGAALLVVVNFQPGSNIQGQLRVPLELSAAVKLAQSVDVRMILCRSGAVNNLIGTLTVDALASTGFTISIENQATQVYSLTASQTRAGFSSHAARPYRLSLLAS